MESRLTGWRSVLLPFAFAALVAGAALFLTQRHTPPTSLPNPTPSPAPVPLPSQPPPRGGAAIGWDPVHNRLVVFGGFGLGQGVLGEFLDDTWTWDGRRWLRAADDNPGARVGAVMAWDIAVNRMLLIGGFGPGGRGPLADTWAWDGSSWSRLQPEVQPESLLLPAMSAEARGDGVLQLTRSTGFSLPSITWGWDQSAGWRLVTTESPPLHSTALMAPTEAGGAVVLVDASVTSPGAGETWTWDGQAWAVHTAAGPPVFDPLSAVMAGSPATGDLVLFEGANDPAAVTGRTLTWDGTRWTARAPTGPVTAAGMVTNGADGHALLIGGPRRGDLTELWEWRGGQWRSLGP